MLTSKMCGEFDTLWRFFPDELNESGEYYISGGTIKKYCPNKNCDSDINKIHAGCLWLLNQFYGDYDKFSNNANGKIDIVIYIMTWLGYKLNQKLNTKFPNLNEFYNKHIENADEYNNHIDDVDDYSSYKDLINKKKEYIDIDIKDMSKFYDAFKILCKMIINADKKDDGKTYLEKANEFVKKYKELNEGSNNIQGNSYNKILSVLSNDYIDYGKYSIHSHVKKLHPQLITEKKIPQVSESRPNETQMDSSSRGISTSSSDTTKSTSDTTEPTSDTTAPSSSTLNKFISIPFIFVVTLILLGIAYKVNNKSIKNIFNTE
ncbi:hypothetical protein YYC_02383 [Plasmodium yoelii 17X]|uniref:Uncharacterized protein n=1 Tax=Plasmodium yoelii 17X TaxID=1323249 RepID=V7PM02_PLAYE|nr:hypothetical protein YYC_02383 [Plasmodium yoelii 17X]